MKQFISFTRKEFIHIFRDKRSLLILLAMPVILVLLPGYVIKNDVRNIRVAVLDPSRDSYTNLISNRFAANDYFIMQEPIESEEEALKKFLSGELDIALIFCDNFADRLIHTGDAGIQILADGSEPNQASVRVAYAQQIISSLRKELSAAAVAPAAININISTQMLHNPQQRSEINFVPGIVSMVMMLICCMMTSIAIVRERETGTMEILLASPLPTIDIVLAKLVPYLVIAIIDLGIILSLAVFLMGIPFQGSFALYLLTALIYILCSLMLGLLISTCANTQLTAMLLSLLLIIPTIYLSGMVFDISSMPRPAQIMSNIVPAKWFVTASRRIMIEGAETRYVIKEIIILSAETIVFLLLSWKLFKTRLE